MPTVCHTDPSKSGTLSRASEQCLRTYTADSLRVQTHLQNSTPSSKRTPRYEKRTNAHELCGDPARTTTHTTNRPASTPPPPKQRGHFYAPNTQHAKHRTRSKERQTARARRHPSERGERGERGATLRVKPARSGGGGGGAGASTHPPKHERTNARQHRTRQYQPQNTPRTTEHPNSTEHPNTPHTNAQNAQHERQTAPNAL